MGLILTTLESSLGTGMHGYNNNKNNDMSLSMRMNSSILQTNCKYQMSVGLQK